jgi:hypothetical protein
MLVNEILRYYTNEEDQMRDLRKAEKAEACRTGQDGAPRAKPVVPP